LSVTWSSDFVFYFICIRHNYIDILDLQAKNVNSTNSGNQRKSL